MSEIEVETERFQILDGVFKVVRRVSGGELFSGFLLAVDPLSENWVINWDVVVSVDSSI